MIEEVLREHGVPVEEVFARVDSGEALATIRDEHERYAASHDVWGVPTFIAGDQAVFVRLMDRSPLGADATASRTTIERIVDLVGAGPNSTSSNTPPSHADPRYHLRRGESARS